MKMKINSRNVTKIKRNTGVKDPYFITGQNEREETTRNTTVTKSAAIRSNQLRNIYNYN